MKKLDGCIVDKTDYIIYEKNDKKITNFFCFT